MRYDFKCLNEECDYRETISIPMEEMQGTEQYPQCIHNHGRMGRIYSENCLAEWSWNKGRFPYVDENLGDKPVLVESQQHRRRLMKERGLHDKDFSYGAKARAAAAKRKHFTFGG